MRARVCSWLLCLALAGFGASWLLAQDTDTGTKSKAEIRTITGCLEKGKKADEFMLKGDDGSTWEVRSSTVALGEHVGHEVSATGVVSHNKAHNMKEDAKEAAHDSGMTKSDNEYGHLKVTDVQMVSKTCTK